MAFLGRSLILALAAAAAGGAVVSLSRQKMGGSRPFVKSAVRAGLRMFDDAREAVGVLSETASDLVAEARAELEEERESGARPHDGGGEHVVPFAMRAAPEGERNVHG